MADVLRLMHRAGESGRAARLRAGRIPKGPDFNHFAAHVGAAVRQDRNSLGYLGRQHRAQEHQAV